MKDRINHGFILGSAAMDDTVGTADGATVGTADGATAQRGPLARLHYLLHTRTQAEPDFAKRFAFELLLAATLQTLAELQLRGARFAMEFDYVLAGVLTAVIGKGLAAFRSAPSTAGLTNAFAKGEYSLSSRMKAFLVQSYAIIYYHILSYTIIYYRLLSYIIVYYHILSQVDPALTLFLMGAAAGTSEACYS
jgi:hypothetical protein